MIDPHIIETCCDICGEPGMTTIGDSAEQWLGGQLRHTDPNVCARNLKRRKEELDKRENKAKENQCQKTIQKNTK